MKPVLLGYFVRRITVAVLLVWTAIWALMVFFEMLRSADDKSLLTAFLLALVKSPQPAMETLPFACAIGGVLAMRRMVGDGEMPALRTAGLSPAMIVVFQLIAALPFVAFYILLSEVLLPSGADIARAMNNQTSTVQGLWLANDSDYIRIEEIDSRGILLSVVIYHTRDDELVGITRAAHADYDSDNAQWLLSDVQHFDRDGGALAEKRLQQQPWQLPLQPSSFSAFTRQPQDMAVHDAMRAAAELAAAGQHNSQLQKTIWQRWLTLPALLLLAALGVGFIGSDKRRRYALSLPVLTAALLAGVYYVARDLAVQGAALSDTPLLLLLLPPLAFAGTLAYHIRRANAV